MMNLCQTVENFQPQENKKKKPQFNTVIKNATQIKSKNMLRPENDTRCIATL